MFQKPIYVAEFSLNILVKSVILKRWHILVHVTCKKGTCGLLELKSRIKNVLWMKKVTIYPLKRAREQGRPRQHYDKIKAKFQKCHMLHFRNKQLSCAQLLLFLERTRFYYKTQIGKLAEDKSHPMICLCRHRGETDIWFKPIRNLGTRRGLLFSTTLLPL
jgi:hypothetical protein